VSAAQRAAWRDRRLTPLGFVLDGREYLVPDPPARVWVLAVLSPEPADLLLDLLPEDVAAELWEDVQDPECDTTPDLLYRIGQTLLGAAAGRPWWQATQLVAQLVEDWVYLDGRAADRALGDPLDWSVERLCNWVYLRLVEHADAATRARIDAQLAAPPVAALTTAGEDEVPEGWEDESSSWDLAAAQLGGSTRA